MKKQWLLLGSLLVADQGVVYSARDFDDNVEGSGSSNIDAGDVENARELNPELDKNEHTDMDVVLNSGRKSSDLILYAGDGEHQEQLQTTQVIETQVPEPAPVSQAANVDVTAELAGSDDVAVDPNGPTKRAINKNLNERLGVLDPSAKARLVLSQGSVKHINDGYYNQLVECQNARNAFNEALQANPFDQENIELKQLEYEAAFGKLTEAIKGDSITLRAWSSFKSFVKTTRVGKYVTEFLAKRKARQIVLNTPIGKAIEADSQNPFSKDQLASLVEFTKAVKGSIELELKGDKATVEDIPGIIDGQLTKYNAALAVVFPKISKIFLVNRTTLAQSFKVAAPKTKSDLVTEYFMDNRDELSPDQKACAYDIIRQAALLADGQKITQQELENGYQEWLRTFVSQVLGKIEGGAEHLKDLQNNTVRGLDPDSSEA